jgi:hypothetical protein
MSVRRMARSYIRVAPTVAPKRAGTCQHDALVRHIPCIRARQRWSGSPAWKGAGEPEIVLVPPSARNPVVTGSHRLTGKDLT